MTTTGPRSAEGKARTARNGFKGGQRRELRKLATAVKAILRASREQLAEIEAHGDN